MDSNAKLPASENPSAPAAAPVPRPRGRADRKAAITVLVVLLAGGVGCRMGSGSVATSEASSAGPPVAAQPPAPPPPHQVALATAVPSDLAANGPLSLESQVSRLHSIAAELEPALGKASLDGLAPSALIAPAGGRQADLRKLEIPRHARWEVRFPGGNSLESYTRQLDYFKIELGFVGGEDHITYLSNLSNPKPQVRQGPPGDEKRLYIVWQRGAMSEADEQLAARAGVKTDGKVLAHFLPAAVEDELVRLEDASAQQSKTAKVGRTVFGIRAAGLDNFKFFVIEQQADLP